MATVVVGVVASIPDVALEKVLLNVKRVPVCCFRPVYSGSGATVTTTVTVVGGYWIGVVVVGKVSVLVVVLKIVVPGVVVTTIPVCCGNVCNAARSTLRAFQEP